MAQNIDAAKLASHLQEHFKKLNPNSIAVALSGGGDSWALALLAYDYCQQHNISFIALTVDHQLRPESTSEAQIVAAECAQRGMKHEMLIWQHGDITARKQEQARTARYHLLTDYCTAHNIPYLLTAHHADDQAETVLMRFAKGSGSAGLAGMAASRPLNEHVTLLRPLLDVRKSTLLAYAADKGVPIINDPSNESTNYARGRLRHVAEVLAAEGLTTETLLKTAAAARDEREALEFAAHELILTHVIDGELPVTTWEAAPLALQQIAWQKIWRQVTDSADYPPDRESVQALCQALADAPTKRTLGGMIAERKRIKGIEIIRFYPEKSAEISAKLIVS